MAKLIYKICPAPMWQAAEQAGVFHGAPVDLSDGFIHFSTADPGRQTAAKHIAAQHDLVVVALDDAALRSPLKYEASRGGPLLPHLYASMPCEAVAWVTPLPLGADGQHEFPVLPE